jgi:hypothetical protein
MHSFKWSTIARDNLSRSSVPMRLIMDLCGVFYPDRIG